MGPAEHEKLVVYRRALELAVALERVAVEIPDRRADLRDQLRRASASVPLNLAEGAGEFRPGEKARFYRIARRSAAECLAILDLADRLTGASPASSTARPMLAEVGAMLTALVKKVERRAR